MISVLLARRNPPGWWSWLWKSCSLDLLSTATGLGLVFRGQGSFGAVLIPSCPPSKARMVMFNFTFCALSASSLCFPFKEAVV